MDRFTPDQKVRDEALKVSGSFIVEAPAGSGKTNLLIARYLCLLSRVSHPRQILAVTYTRKAAVEMKDRVVQKLDQASKGKREGGEGPWEDFLLSLAQKALEKQSTHPSILFNPDSLQIGTFHSFCASLLRAWPLESGIPPGLDLLGEIDQEPLLQKAVDQYSRNLVSEEVSEEEQNAFLNRLASANNNAETLSEQIKTLLRRRERLEDIPFSSSGESPGILKEELHRRLGAYAESFLSPLRDYFLRHEAGWMGLKEALVAQGANMGKVLPKSIPGVQLEEIPAWKSAAKVFLTGGGTRRKMFTAQYGFPKGFGSHPSAALITTLPDDETKRMASVMNWPDPEEDSLGLEAIREILTLAKGAKGVLDDLIRTQGMDYVELEIGALRALGQAEGQGFPSESLIFQHEHLKHILVDEAQDMNDLQAEILSRLTEGWEPGDGRTVFVVGDPKQSIYRFRRAEVGLFDELKEKGLGRSSEASLPLKPLLLTSNFRSRPHLIGFANRLFEKVMASPRREYDEVKFFPSQPIREKPGRPLVTRAAIFNSEKGVKDSGLSSREREALWVAGEVARLHRKRPGETIGVLIPARTHLPLFVKALAALGVPLCLLEGELLKGRPEVVHLLNLFIAMIRPHDDVAWVGALRAPWCRISDEALATFRDGSGFWSERILSGSIVHPGSERFCESINEARKMFGREPYGTTLSRLWEDMEGPRKTAALYAAAGVSNAKSFLNLLDLCSGMVGEEALLQLSRLLENAYTPPDPKGAFSNVSMMTIHRAKGLEFDHVFAVNLDYSSLKGGRHEQPAYRMERLPGEEKHFLAAATADRRTGEQNIGSYLLKDLSERRVLAEARRLFYVAATRARESLTLSGMGQPPRGEGDEEFKTPLSSLLGIMKSDEEGFRLLFNPLSSSAVEGEATFMDLVLPPPPFDPDPLPYLVTSPSRIEDETALATEPGAEEEEGYARVRGVMIHRIFERFARRQPEPEPAAIAMALSREGIPIKEAEKMARQVLEEARRAWEEPEFLALRESAKRIHSEWAIEDFDGGRMVRVGRFDLLLEMEDRWLLVDYKTGRPEKGEEAWIEGQLRRHHHQLQAYSQMIGRTLGLPEEKIEWAVLFTALPRLVRQGMDPLSIGPEKG